MPRRGEWEGILFFSHIKGKVLEKGDGIGTLVKKGFWWSARTGVLILLYLSRQPEPFSSPSKKTPAVVLLLLLLLHISLDHYPCTIPYSFLSALSQPECYM